MRNRITHATVASVLFILTGCATMEPELPKADPQLDQSWLDAQNAKIGNPTSGYNATEASRLSWQEFFTDPRLEQLIQQALENNRDLRVATLNVERARAQYRIQRADRVPALNASAALNRLGGDGQAEVEQYQAQLGVTQFELDLFGRVKSLSNAALQSYLATDYGQKSAQLSLIAEVANAYLALAADQELQRLAEASYQSYEETVRITEKQFDLGAASALSLSQARTQLASAKADIAQFASQVDRDKTALALLVGGPVTADTLPEAFDLKVSGLASIPASLPSQSLLQRPDIQQAESALRAANANIGAARAAYFPSISLTGTIGSLSGDLSDLFSSGTDTWSFIPQVTLPLFQGGKLRANHKVATIDRDIALANYEQAIQGGFKEVADALIQTGRLADRREALEDFVASATETESLSQSRYDAGRDSYLTLLDAQRTLYSARQALVQSQLQEQSNRINLYKVLGGGWNAES